MIGYFVWGLTCSITVSFITLCLFAAEEGNDQYVEESEVTTCETKADESIPLKKPSTRVKLQARNDSVQVPGSQLSTIITTNDTVVILSLTYWAVLLHRCIVLKSLLTTGKEISWFLWAVFPRWEKACRLHPGLQEVQSPGGKEVHLWEESTGWGSNAGEGGKTCLVLEDLYVLDSSTQFSKSCVSF